jgi:3'(2'), 5'-bisphosphate nucleotidase
MPVPIIADREALLNGLALAAREAGAAIMVIFNAGFEVEHKADASPVTIADRSAEAIILAALARLAAAVPVVAEEEAAAGRIPDVHERFFLVDPLDGTKEFVRRSTDFTVNIGLIEDGVPTLGVVYAPARGVLYAGDVARHVAWRIQDGETKRVDLHVRAPANPPVAVASKSHDTPQTEAYLTLCKCGKRVSIGSSLKFCLLADGEADFYPRPAPTYEWDTAAGQAVLDAAGGAVYDLEGAPFRYGKPNFFNPGFLAVGGLRGLPALASCELKACGA